MAEKGRNLYARRAPLAEVVQTLRTVRQAQGVSLVELERRTDFRKSTLWQLENDPNANPTVRTLMRIATALNREITVEVAPPPEET